MIVAHSKPHGIVEVPVAVAADWNNSTPHECSTPNE
jgi:hypothetical protein